MLHKSAFLSTIRSKMYLENEEHDHKNNIRMKKEKQKWCNVWQEDTVIDNR